MEPKVLTEEEQKESNERIEGFVKDYRELTNKWNVDLMAYPQFQPSKAGGFVVQVVPFPVDKKQVPVPSPFIKEK